MSSRAECRLCTDEVCTITCRSYADDLTDLACPWGGQAELKNVSVNESEMIDKNRIVTLETEVEILKKELEKNNKKSVNFFARLMPLQKVCFLHFLKVFYYLTVPELGHPSQI